MFRNVSRLLSRPAASAFRAKPQFTPAAFNRVMGTASTRTFGADNFATGANANYIDHMYSQWEADNSSVHASWHAYFTSIESGASTTF